MKAVVAERSGVGAVVHYDRLPKFPIADAAEQSRCVIAGGDDYELVFTAAQGARAGIEALSGALGLALTRAGSIQTGEPKLQLLDARGLPIAAPRGFEHFA